MSSITARCVLRNASNETVGDVRFIQEGDVVRIEGSVSGLASGAHGFHVSPGDSSMRRHVGDLGNVHAGDNGVAFVRLNDSLISLRREALTCIVGRALVVHAGADDLGRTDHKDSKTTGNAGARYACGVIGQVDAKL